jgi:hypothetical protein
VSEGEAAHLGWVMAHPARARRRRRVRAARGFYIAQSGRCPDLLVIWGGAHRTREGCFDVALPVLAGEHRAATLTPSGAAEVSRGEPG